MDSFALLLLSPMSIARKAEVAAVLSVVVVVAVAVCRRRRGRRRRPRSHSADGSRILTFVEAVAAAAVVTATTLAVGYSRSSSLSWTNEAQHHSLKSIAYLFSLPAVFWL